MQEGAEELEYVGFWLRVLASLVDTLLLCLALAPAIWLLAGVSGETNRVAESGDGWMMQTAMMQGRFELSPLASLMINWVLPAAAVLAFWWFKSSTPGKMLLGARIVDAKTGAPMTPGQAALRYLGYFVSCFPFLLGLIWVGLDARKQGWHDKIAGTVVVRAKRLGKQPVRFEQQA
ncbi:RDD family protein [Chromobacterium rhizoryzae]|uniref:RDD family protein n=1 Tax=Chromobacterium rhizoryzae TaxID=1778675 RepID=A0AAD0RTI3_9NEIS|nr:RDD family protein [Chromobacterium rhizoryzae]AXT48232.1 RDD family protein [Chromobacterium rhizoryzae]